MTGPLSGLTVVDATWGMPGAVTTMVLADYGADVVKVERPGGGPDRDNPAQGGVGAGQALGRPRPRPRQDDVETLRALIGRADVFLESFRPGVAGIARLRLRGRPRRAPAPRLLLDLRLRPGRSVARPARLRLPRRRQARGDGRAGRPSRRADLPRSPEHRLRHGVPGDDRHPERAAGPAHHGRGPARRHVAARQRRRPERHELVVERPRRVVPGPQRQRARLRPQPHHHRPVPVPGRRVPDDPHRRRRRLQANDGHPRRRGVRPGTIDGPEMAVPLDDDEYHAARHLAPAAFGSRAARRVGRAVPRRRPRRAAGAAPHRGAARRPGRSRRRRDRAARPAGPQAAPGRAGRPVPRVTGRHARRRLPPSAPTTPPTCWRRCLLRRRRRRGVLCAR